MKLITNTSSVGIKINLSFIKPDGQHLQVELNNGESILVDDNSTNTKSIIIQNKKGNISIESDVDCSFVIPYQKYSKTETENNARRQNIVDKWEESGLLEGLTGTVNPEIVSLIESEPSHILNIPEVPLSQTPEIISNEIENDSKGKPGRPKGSVKKKGPGRPKGSKKKRKNKKSSVLKPISTENSGS